MKTERIDGNDHVIGTPDHLAAVRARQTRMDAAYVEAHPRELEQNIRTIERHLRLDANNTALLARDLVYVSAAVERRVYQKLRMAELVPVSTDVPRGAGVVARRLIDMTGAAKVSDLLAGDGPRADVSVTEDLAPLRHITASYGYTLHDLEAAAFARMPLQQERAMSCADAIARKLDAIGRSGTTSDPDGDAKLRGLFNNPNVTVLTLTNGEWPSATAAEILADLHEIEAAMIAASLDTISAPVKLVLPTAYERRLHTLKADASASDSTVGEHFLRNAALIKEIVRYGALDSMVTPDIAAADAPMGMAFESSPDVMTWPIPIAYEQLAPEVRGFEWIVNARARCGGVDIRRPYACLYIANLD